MKKLWGVTLVVTAFVPIILAVAVVVGIRGAISDVENVASGPNGQAVVQEIQAAATSVGKVRVYTGKLVSEAKQKATQVAQFRKDVASIPDSIPAHSVDIPVPQVVFATTVPVSISYPSELSLKDVITVNTTTTTLTIPGISREIRYPSGFSARGGVTYDTITLGFQDINRDVTYPSGISVNPGAAIVATKTITFPTVRYPSGLEMGKHTIYIPRVTGEAGASDSTIAIPAVSKIVTALNKVLDIGAVLSSYSTDLVDTVTAPEEHITEALTHSQALAQELVVVKDRYTDYFTLFGIIFVIWLVIVTLESTVNRVQRGWKLIRTP
jgi:hypothetical protein